MSTPILVLKKRLLRMGVGGIYLCVIATVLGALYAFGYGLKTRTIPEGNIELSTTYGTYQVGESVGFVVKNKFNSAVYLANSCPSEPLDVYKFDGTKWQHIHEKSTTKNCAKEPREIKLAAASNASANFDAWPNLFTTPGRYRIVAYVPYYDQLPTAEFEIIPKPVLPAIPVLVQ
jgi:hypothetical protein